MTSRRRRDKYQDYFHFLRQQDCMMLWTRQTGLANLLNRVSPATWTRAATSSWISDNFIENAASGGLIPPGRVSESVVMNVKESETLSTAPWTKSAEITLTESSGSTNPARRGGKVWKVNNTAATAFRLLNSGNFAINNTKATIGVIVKYGNTPAGNVYLADVSTPGNKIILVLAWNGGVPSVTATAGTALTPRRIGKTDYWWVGGYSTALTSGNNHQVWFYPSGVGAVAGYTYLAGVNCWAGVTYFMPYVLTTTLGVTTTQDQLQVALPLTTAPKYARTYAIMWTPLEPIAKFPDAFGPFMDYTDATGGSLDHTSLSLSGAGGPNFIFRVVDDSATAFSLAIPDTGQKRHIAICVRQSGNSYWYLDRVKSAVSAASFAVEGTRTPALSIGGIGSIVNSGPALFHQMLVFNRAFNDQQAMKLQDKMEYSFAA